MPTYEYHCKACDHEFEEVQRITEDPIQKCPACGKKKVRRLISNTSFVLKGGGWYDDGYHGKGGTKKDEANGSTKAEATAPTPKADSQKSDSSQSPSKKGDSKKSGGKKSGAKSSD